VRGERLSAGIYPFDGGVKVKIKRLKAGLLALTAGLAAALATQASAAGLPGSFKNPYSSPLLSTPSAGPCYLRADAGYAVAGDPDTVSLDNTWLVEVGGGCGSGSRGLRADVSFGFHGEQDASGIDPTLNTGLDTSVTSYTLMFNAYYDLGTFHGFVPYLGAGLGGAYNMVDEVTLAGSPNRIQDNDEWSFAWSLMAGVAYQVSDRAILDFGYRYINMGEARSGSIDTAGAVVPQLVMDDLSAHEFKVGIRYHFGGSRCCEYTGLK
jgi:opacity protein-like surface antigen